jgi:hypothetical protein
MSNKIGYISYGIGILALLLITAVFSGKKVPLIGNGKAAFIILWILGFSMSILGGTRDYPDGKFTLPGFLLYFLMFLGFLAIILLPLMLLKVRLPFITTYKEAFNLLSVIIILKWATVHLYKLLNLLM